MDKFVKFWGCIWERDDHTPNMLWMEEMQEELKEKITSMKEFGITKNGEKVYTSTKKYQRKFAQLRDDNRLIPTWWLLGRTVMIPKSKDLSDEKNYHPVRCLNTQYNHLNGLVGKFMRNHAMENNI